MTEPFFETRIVTKNTLSDVVEHIRNKVGLRQRGYEEMVQNAAEELIGRAHENYDVEWFRVDTDMVGPGAIQVTVYGQGEPTDDEA